MCRWWTREHEVVDKGWKLEQKTVSSGPRQTTTHMVARHDPAADRVHRWTTAEPFPEKVTVTELKRLLAVPIDSGLSEK